MARIKKSEQLLTKLRRSMDKPAAVPTHDVIDSSSGIPAVTADFGDGARSAPSLEPVASNTFVLGSKSNRVDEASASKNERLSDAYEIVKRHIPFALAAGIVPIPLVDIVSISGVQLKLIAALSVHYKVAFNPHRARNVFMALLGGFSAWTFAIGSFGSIAKALPGVGTFFGASTLPIISGAITYATGQVFIRHFESGGTLLNFDVSAAQKLFAAKIEEGEVFVRSL